MQLAVEIPIFPMALQRTRDTSDSDSVSSDQPARQRRQVRRFVAQSDSDEYRDGEDDDYQDE